METLTNTIHTTDNMDPGAAINSTSFTNSILGGNLTNSHISDTAGDYWQNITNVNMTTLWLSDMIWYYINGIVGTIIAVLGIPGNVTAAIVLLLPAMKNSTSLLLFVMAIFDTFFLALHMLLQSLPLIFMTNEICDDYLVITEFLFKYCYALVHIARTGTIYMTVLITLERAIVVLLPIKAKQICTRGRAGIASLLVLFWSIVYNIPRCIEFTAETDEAMKITEYTVKRSHFGKSYFLNSVYFIYLNSVFHFIIPVGMIVALNIRIIQRICTRGQRQGRQGRSARDSQTRLTIMIIILTAIFCFCQLITSLELILYPWEPVGGASDQSRASCLTECSIISAVAETSTLVNSATNFIVYSIFGNKFRRCLAHLCCHCCKCYSLHHRRFFFSSMYSRQSRMQNSTTMTQLTRIRKSSLVRMASDESAKRMETEGGLDSSEETKITENFEVTSPM